jgi:hypothetical protein
MRIQYRAAKPGADAWEEPGAVINPSIMSDKVLRKTVLTTGYSDEDPSFFQIQFTDNSTIMFDVDAPTPRLVFIPNKS